MCENVIRSKVTIEDFSKLANEIQEIMITIESASDGFRRQFFGVMGSLFILNNYNIVKKFSDICSNSDLKRSLKRAKECITLMKSLLDVSEREKFDERIKHLKSQYEFNMKQPFENCFVLRLLGFNFR